MDGGGLRRAQLVCGTTEHGGAPGRLVGQAVATNLAVLDELLHGLHLLDDRHRLALFAAIELPRAKRRNVAVWPVNLIQIDVIGLQAFQRAFARIDDVGFVNRSCAVANPITPTGPGDFGAQHHLFAIAGNSQPLAQDDLGAQPRFGLRWHRIHLGGVNKIHAMLHCPIELRMGLSFGVLLAPSHGAQADDGDVEIGVK